MPGRMDLAFVPLRSFLGVQTLTRTRAPHLSAPSKRIFTAEASMTARERRRAVEHARTTAHRDIKRELESRPGQVLSAIVSVPGSVRERCLLTPRMARVKVLLEKGDLNDVSVFRGRVRSGLVRLFPELEHRGLLRASDGFDLKVGGSGIIRNESDLRKGVEKCQTVGTAVYVEVIPHNTPPPKPPLSPRVQEVSDKAREAARHPNSLLHMISFYKFTDIARPDITSELLHKAWSRMGIKGRVYVAKEGVNAQLSVPDVVLSDFRDAMSGMWFERGETIIPLQITNVFLNTDEVVTQSEEPFQKLSVRPRDKVLADGFQEPLDWKKAGREIPPKEWHRLLSEESDDTIVLDCRNSYESDVGIFEGAEPLNTRAFRESWAELEKRMQNEDREKKVLTYCTGGIRCVKVNAFLEQKMGFKNTGRLEGGIVSYARTLRQEGKLSESKFKGVNHVFDGRMGEVITDDLIHRCDNCGRPCNTQTDCANVSCPRPFDKRMFVQCPDCAAVLSGACSKSCQDVIKLSSALPEDKSTVESVSGQQHFVRDSSPSERYADQYTAREGALLRGLRQTTEKQFPRRAHMLSSHTQASFLKLLVATANASRVLEIGTFTGYTALTMASALPSRGLLVTCDTDPVVLAVAREYLAKDTQYGEKVEMRQGRGQEVLEGLISSNVPPFDIAFIDADKGGYETYYQLILNNGLLRVGGLLVFDNVLFRGEVAELAAIEDGKLSDLPNAELVNGLLSKGSRNTAKKLHAFNKMIRDDSRVEQVMIPFRDGLTIARRLH